MLTVFGWSIIHFISSIPGGVAATHLSPALAALSAFVGYVVIAAAMLLIGAPARVWLNRKFKVSPQPDPKKLFWRVWLRWGMPGLGFLAPITIGPYLAALLALALGEKPGRLMLWIALGVIPWCIVFAVLAATGVKIFG